MCIIQGLTKASWFTGERGRSIFGLPSCFSVFCAIPPSRHPNQTVRISLSYIFYIHKEEQRSLILIYLSLFFISVSSIRYWRTVLPTESTSQQSTTMARTTTTMAINIHLVKKKKKKLMAPLILHQMVMMKAATNTANTTSDSTRVVHRLWDYPSILLSERTKYMDRIIQGPQDEA